MKKIITIVLLMGMLLQHVQADSTLRITDVYVSFLDEKVEVTRQVMEIDGGTSGSMSGRLQNSSLPMSIPNSVPASSSISATNCPAASSAYCPLRSH